MSRKIIKVLVSILGFLLVSSSFALNLESDIILDEATHNSIKISFDEVEWAVGYFVQYDVKSSENWEYAFQWDDIYENNEIIIENLESDTVYYIVVSVIWDDYIEWPLSDEVELSTLINPSAADPLEIESISVLDIKTIELIFNKNLDEFSSREFLIVNKDDNMEDIIILESTIYKVNSVMISLENDLKAGWEYSITIISLLWVDWEKIEAWVDGIENFSIPVDTPVVSESTSEVFDEGEKTPIYDEEYYNNTEVITENNDPNDNEEPTNETSTSWAPSGWTLWEIEDEDNNIELNSAGLVQGNQEVNVSWTNLTDEQLSTNAANADKLPTTWPENWILLVLALVFWITYIVIRKRSV